MRNKIFVFVPVCIEKYIKWYFQVCLQNYRYYSSVSYQANIIIVVKLDLN